MSYPRRFVGTVTTLFNCRQNVRPFPEYSLRFPRVPQGWPFRPPSGWGSASCSPPPGVFPVQVSAFSHPSRPPSSLRGFQDFSSRGFFLTSSYPHAGIILSTRRGGWGMIPSGCLHVLVTHVLFPMGPIHLSGRYSRKETDFIALNCRLPVVDCFILPGPGGEGGVHFNMPHPTHLLKALGRSLISWPLRASPPCDLNGVRLQCFSNRWLFAFCLHSGCFLRLGWSQL